jgi:hypothetical protein
MLAASGTAVIGWLTFNRAYKSDIEYVPVIIRPPLEGVPWRAISDQVVRFTFPGGSFPGWLSTDSILIDHGLNLWVLGLTALCSAVPVALMIGLDMRGGQSQARWLGFLGLASSPLLATMIIAFNLLDGSPGFVRIIDRYHLSVIPIWLVCLGTVLTIRRLTVTAISTLVFVGLVVQFAVYLTATA